MNRAERRKATYLDHPAYVWAIESDWPHKDAKLLVYCIQYHFSNRHLEVKMGERLTFTKFTKARVFVVTDNAIQVSLGGDRDLGKTMPWIARSNIRSDDDRRMDEVSTQLSSRSYIDTPIHVVDWLVRKEGYTP